jgi:hypothetical protein
MNEWKMKLVLWDIYGNSANLNFILIIVENDPNFAACLTDPTVVKKPFALDHTYVIGSLWRHKIHIPRPMTKGLLDCTSQFVIIGRIINDQGRVE